MNLVDSFLMSSGETDDLKKKKTKLSKINKLYVNKITSNCIQDMNPTCSCLNSLTATSSAANSYPSKDQNTELHKSKAFEIDIERTALHCEKERQCDSKFVSNRAATKYPDCDCSIKKGYTLRRRQNFKYFKKQELYHQRVDYKDKELSSKCNKKPPLVDKNYEDSVINSIKKTKNTRMNRANIKKNEVIPKKKEIVSRCSKSKITLKKLKERDKKLQEVKSLQTNAFKNPLEAIWSNKFLNELLESEDEDSLVFKSPLIRQPSKPHAITPRTALFKEVMQQEPILNSSANSVQLEPSKDTLKVLYHLMQNKPRRSARTKSKKANRENNNPQFLKKRIPPPKLPSLKENVEENSSFDDYFDENEI